MAQETSDQLRKQIENLHSEAARLRAESDRLIKLSKSLADEAERLEKKKKGNNSGLAFPILSPRCRDEII
jgi:hypothetical protein